MSVEVEIQKSALIEWAAHQQSEHSLPQTDLGLNKILQQTDPLEFESDEMPYSEHDRASGHY